MMITISTSFALVPNCVGILAKTLLELAIVGSMGSTLNANDDFISVYTTKLKEEEMVSCFMNCNKTCDYPLHP